MTTLRSTPDATGTARATRMSAAVAAPSARLAKAQQGLVKVASPKIARYFERNAANPFSEKGGATAVIPLVTIPRVLSMTAMAKELVVAQRDEARLQELVEPLGQLLKGKGYDARFFIQVGGEHKEQVEVAVVLRPTGA